MVFASINVFCIWLSSMKLFLWATVFCLCCCLLWSNPSPPLLILYFPHISYDWADYGTLFLFPLQPSLPLSLSWVVCCFLIPDSWVFIWFVAWWAGGGAAVARRGSKVDGNPNLITIQLCILCILWLDPTTSNPASCAALLFPAIFLKSGHQRYFTAIIMTFFVLSSVGLGFPGNADKTFSITQSRHCGLCWRLGGWRSNTIPLKMVYRNLMNAQIPLISAGTPGKQDRNASTIFAY